MEYPYFKGLEADRYSFYRVPKALVKADPFQKMSGDAKLLYAVLLDRMSLSIKNGWQDKHGNAYIICTIEEVMDSIHCARQKAVKLLDELEQEFRLIERRRQGLGKPNLLYVKDLYAGLSQSNYWKYENHTSGSLKNELPGVPKSNGSNTEKINKTDYSETDLIYPAELQEEEQYRCYFKEALELEILEQGYPADKAVLYEILELLVETVTSRKKFLRICGEEKPKEVVKSRLMKLDSSHIQYILECLKENSTQIRNIKQYLLNTAKTKQELDSAVFQTAGIAQKFNCTLNRLDYLQEQGLMSSLPLANNLVPIKRALTTTSTAIFVPFTTQELFMEGDSLYYGLNAVSNNMIMADRKQLKNPNGLILGTPGSGKSFSAKREITNVFFTTRMIEEAEKYLGMPYVWGGSSPSTSFDCSGFVCWVINNSGNGWSVGRTTANGLRGKCSYVSPADAQPGDLIFFEKTYNTVGASHVGIYVGNGMMIHCGDPISYTTGMASAW